MSTLTDRQHAILTACVDHVDQHGYPPTVRELGAAVGLRSTSTVVHHLAVLADLGLLRVDATSSRAIDVRPARAAGYGTQPVTRGPRTVPGADPVAAERLAGGRWDFDRSGPPHTADVEQAIELMRQRGATANSIAVQLRTSIRWVEQYLARVAA